MARDTVINFSNTELSLVGVTLINFSKTAF